jgi:hypothetical protein
MTCDTCMVPMLPATGPGRPRVRCQACAADRSALGRAWRAANPARVDAYNASRRGYPQGERNPLLPTASRTRARAGFVASVTEPFFRKDTP